MLTCIHIKKPPVGCRSHQRKRKGSIKKKNPWQIPQPWTKIIIKYKKTNLIIITFYSLYKTNRRRDVCVCVCCHQDDCPWAYTVYMLYTVTTETTITYRDTRRYKGDRLDHLCWARCAQDRIVHLDHNPRPPADWMHSQSVHEWPQPRVSWQTFWFPFLPVKM